MKFKVKNILITTTVSASIFSLFSCATSTPYKKAEKGSLYGLSIENTKNNSKASVFYGNEYTSKANARKYSILGAMENCAEEKKFALMFSQPDDLSINNNYVQVTTTTKKNYYGQNTSSSYATPVSITYPLISTEYKCSEKILNLKNISKISNISAELVNVVTKDLQGAVKVTEVKDENDSKGLVKNDVIIKLNFKRITNSNDLDMFKNESQEGKVDLEIIRDAKIIKLKSEIYDTAPTFAGPYKKLYSSICPEIKEEVSQNIAQAKKKTTDFDLACVKVKAFISSLETNNK